MDKAYLSLCAAYVESALIGICEQIPFLTLACISITANELHACTHSPCSETVVRAGKYPCLAFHAACHAHHKESVYSLNTNNLVSDVKITIS